jgi:plastocyanin
MRFKLLFLFFLAGFTLVNGPASVFAKSTDHTVIIENMKFTPAELTVAAGDLVAWENKDLVPHTVTAKNGAFDSKAIMPGKTWKWRSRKQGRIEYKCLFHPTMEAVVVIK